MRSDGRGRDRERCAAARPKWDVSVSGRGHTCAGRIEGWQPAVACTNSSPPAHIRQWRIACVGPGLRAPEPQRISCACDRSVGDAYVDASQKPAEGTVPSLRTTTASSTSPLPECERGAWQAMSGGDQGRPRHPHPVPAAGQDVTDLCDDSDDEPAPRSVCLLQSTHPVQPRRFKEAALVRSRVQAGACDGVITISDGSDGNWDVSSDSDSVSNGGSPARVHQYVCATNEPATPRCARAQ